MSKISNGRHQRRNAILEQKNIFRFWLKISKTNNCSPSWELELRPLGVATGNASSVTRVWRYICKNTIRWPATAHDVTTGATIIKGSPGEYIISFFVFIDWSVWRNVHSGRNTVFLYLSWRALARRSRSVWIRVLVIWHPMTHTIVASFVWAKSTHAMSLRGQSACTVSCSLWESSVLVCPSFRGKRDSRLLPAIRYPPLPRHRGDWNRGVRSWIWPMS